MCLADETYISATIALSVVLSGLQVAALRALARRYAEEGAPGTAMMVVRREGMDADTPAEPIASLRRPGPCVEAHEAHSVDCWHERRRLLSSASLPKKRNAASAAGGPAPGPENRPTGQGTPQRAQRRGWAMPAPTPGAQNGQPPRPPHGGRQQHHGGQYGPATRASPSPGTQTPGLAPKLPRSGRLGVFRHGRFFRPFMRAALF